MKYDLIKELTWRGMIHDIMPNTEAQLHKEMTSAYIGFDPTADSLHIGNLATMMLLKHLQLAGHKPIILLGGATGMVGDPSGKSKERNLLDETQIQANLAGQRKQLEKFLDFDCGENSAEMVNNYDWFKEIGFIEFLRDVGKHITINYMTTKDSVKKRLELGGLSFTEFSYQLLQGYDFYWLYQHKNCKLQMGGSDQWGNITTGTELIRRKTGGEAYALTTPLLTKSDGTKMGKTAGGTNVWLDAEKTSPYKFYQYWLNIDDRDISKLFRVFTLMTQEEIEALEKEHLESNPNFLKRVLAEWLTKSVHSKEALENAQKASKLLFGKSTLEDFENMPEKLLLEVFEGIEVQTLSQAAYEGFNNQIDFLYKAMESKNVSKSDIRKLIKNNGISVNQEKVKAKEMEEKPSFTLLKDKFILVRKGKKEYFLVHLEK